MSEKSEQFNKTLKKNSDKIAIALLVAILCGMGYAYMQEEKNATTAPSPAKKDANFDDTLVMSPEYQKLAAMSASPDISKSPDIARVAQFNMFDYKTVQAREQVEADASRQVEQAKQLISQGKRDEARAILQSVVSRVSSNREAVQLLNSITPKVEQTPAPQADPNQPPV